jgi:hypothetical protein
MVGADGFCPLVLQLSNKTCCLASLVSGVTGHGVTPCQIWIEQVGNKCLKCVRLIPEAAG